MNPRCLLACLFTVALLSCSAKGTESSPTKSVAEINLHAELRDNLSLEEFHKAIVGSWRSVFSLEGRTNVREAQFDKDTCRLTIIDKHGEPSEYRGSYTLELVRPYDVGSVTFVNISVRLNRDTLVFLPRMCFGDHNGVLQERGPFLRNDREPHAVLALVEE